MALATEVYFNNDVLRKSEVTSDHGWLEVLDPASMVEIEDLFESSIEVRFETHKITKFSTP